MTSTLPPGAVGTALEHLFPQSSKYLTDPVAWAREKMNLYLWSKQVEILESIRDNRLTAVQSCHGPGKTFTASAAGAWWLDPEVHALGSAFLITTAPSWPQVQTILWRELRRRHLQGGLPGRITSDCHWLLGAAGTKRLDASEEIVGMGRKPADYDEDTFQGIHARYLMAILDEANGIPESLWDSVLALATNENSRILAIGNPDDPNSRFAKVCKPGSGWNVIRISVWDVFKAIEEDEIPKDLHPDMVSWQYVEQARREWGEGSPRWQSKVEGLFPDVSDDYLISPALWDRCAELDLPGFDQGRYGVDVARYGTDLSVMYRNRGGVIRLVEKWAKEDTMQSAGRVARILRAHGVRRPPANIDIIGLGAGVFDRLREQRFNVAPFQGSQTALDKKKFVNRRSEIYWTFRQMMEDGAIDVDPADDKLAAELTAIKWTVDSAGRIKLEPKEDFIERLGYSPNHADAAVMSIATAGAIAGHVRGGSKSETADLLTKRM